MLRFYDDEGGCQFSRVGKGQVNSGDVQPFGDVAQTAMKEDLRLAGRLAEDLDVSKVKAALVTLAQSLDHRLPGGKAGGVVLGRMMLAVAIGDFRGVEDLPDHPAVSLPQFPFKSRNISDVRANAEDHTLPQR
jgi:hypothetical protein